MDRKINLYRSGWISGLKDAKQIVEGSRHTHQSTETYDVLSQAAEAMQNLIEVLQELRAKDTELCYTYRVGRTYKEACAQPFYVSIASATSALAAKYGEAVDNGTVWVIRTKGEDETYSYCINRSDK